MGPSRRRLPHGDARADRSADAFVQDGADGNRHRAGNAPPGADQPVKYPLMSHHTAAVDLAAPARPDSSPRRSQRKKRAIAARILAVVAGLAVVAVAAVYALSEWRMRARFEVPRHAFAAPGGALAVARGQRLALTSGCTDCHGTNFGGHVILDNPLIGRAER